MTFFVTKRISRRVALHNLVGLVAASMCWTRVSAAPNGTDEAVRTLWALACELRGNPVLNEMGNEFLSRHPELGNANALTNLLLGRIRRVTTQGRLERRQALRDALFLLVRNDFDQGNFADITGWQLSATEVQLAALASLLTPEQVNVALGTETTP